MGERINEVKNQIEQMLQTLKELDQGSLIDMNKIEKLLKDEGKWASWDFQSSLEMKMILKKELSEYFLAYSSGKPLEKGNTPLFLVLAGVGTGKSRLLTEFPRLASEVVFESDESLQSNAELRQRLSKNTFVFNVSFENGTPYYPSDEQNINFVLGSRMLFQLQATEISFLEFQRYSKDFSPEGVIQYLADGKGISVKEMTVFLMVDGLQKLLMKPEDGLDKTSYFYNCIQNCASLAFRTKAFVIVCCAATVSTPVKQASSTQRRVYLNTRRLEMPTVNGKVIFDTQDLAKKILLDDMGGHGRAIEELWKLIGNRDIADLNLGELMHNLVSNISQRYLDMEDYVSEYKPILHTILSNTRLKITENIPSTNIKVEQIIENGLIWFEKEHEPQVYGRLRCAYIWLWIMAMLSSDEVLRDWSFDNYKVFDKFSSGGYLWQEFEVFVAKFRKLKSRVIPPDTKLSVFDIHKGARFMKPEPQDPSNFNVINQPLSLVLASNHYNTKEGKKMDLNHENGTIDTHDCKHIVLNAASAPYGDAFCFLRSHKTKKKKLIKEVLQMKNYRTLNVTSEEYNKEMEKASESGDVFILYTTGKCDDSQIKPQGRLAGVVDESNFVEYFGPFAARAKIYAQLRQLDLHTATRSLLTGIAGIGDTDANNILTARNRIKRPFKDIEEAAIETQIPRKILKVFFPDP